MNPQQKKRHHYLPVAYLRRFADSEGRVFAYRKDVPSPPLHVRPSAIAFERYYYSQPLPDGGQDNNQLENLFSQYESLWPGLVDDLARGNDVQDRMETLFQFISLLRVRVPAARDAVELHLAHVVRRSMERGVADGTLPPPPAGLSLDNVEISIDPHQSIHAMVSMLEGFAQMWGFVGVELVHNTTPEPFATSDNPVVVFDPDVPEEDILPYGVRPPAGRVELLFPLCSKLLLRGLSNIPPWRAGDQLRHVQMKSGRDVRRVNRFVARFGYRFVFADHGGLSKLVIKHAATSPTIRFNDGPADGDGGLISMRMVFGPRPTKPKWTGENGR